MGNKLKRIKKLVAGLTAAGCCWLSFAGVGGVNAGGCPVGSFSMPAAAAAALREPQVSGSYNSGDTWVVYWYLCGSDLESDYGAASLDLEELSQVNLPPNVKFVIETGGSNTWHRVGVDNHSLTRFLFDSTGVHEISRVDDADMGAPETLTDFLAFGQQFEAQHRALVLWNHGGGSLGGVCLDERTDSIIGLDALQSAISRVYESDESNPPFELIGFDACLMATADTMSALHGLTRVMVASQESEPGNGWKYDGWPKVFSENDVVTAADVGRAIVDSYMDGCREYGTEANATLSLIDVTQTPHVRSALSSYSSGALNRAQQEPQRFFSAFGRAADNTENYGGNTKSTGYMDMIDLASLADNTAGMLPKEAEELAGAVDNAVLYRAAGPYRPSSRGISGYYPYDGGAEMFNIYASLSVASPAVKSLYGYLLSGQTMDFGGEQEGSSVNPSAQSSISSVNHSMFNIASLEDTLVNVDNDGSAFVNLSSEAVDNLSAVHCQLCYISMEDSIVLMLGSDTNIIADWKTGVFKDNFDGTWPMLDGHPVYIEITGENDDFWLYSIPVKHNDRPCSLEAVYDLKEQKYNILGVKYEDSSKGLVRDRNLEKIKPGDKITTRHYAVSISDSKDDQEPVEVDGDTFTVSRELTLADESVGDGLYGYMFEFVTPQNTSALSDFVTYTIKDGSITTAVGIPDASDGGAAGGTGSDSLMTSATSTVSGGSIADAIVGSN